MLISDETILVIRRQSLQTLVKNLYCGLQWFQNSCNFRRVCDLHIAIFPRVLLSFDFPLTYVRIFLLLYHLTFHKTVHSMFHLTFLLATILICRSFFMSVDSLNLKSFSNFSVCKLRQWSLSEPFCSCLFLKNCSRRRKNASCTHMAFFAEVSTKHPPRFSLQAQFKASNIYAFRTFSSSRLFPTMTQGISKICGRTFCICSHICLNSRNEFSSVIE